MSDQVSKHDQVLLALALNLQSIAMVQLGKISSPATGELERDLTGARATIDILEMLKVKCRHDTAAPVVRLLDQTVMDLQMNYLDEFKREQREKQQQPAEPDTADAEASPPPAAEDADGAAQDSSADAEA